MRTAIIDPTGKVINVVMVGEDYTPPEGTQAIPSDSANVGDLYENKGFTAPTPTSLDYGVLISTNARGIIEQIYGDRSRSVNNYLGQLAALSSLGSLSDDQKKDLTVLLSLSDWEQRVLDQMNTLLKTPDRATYEKSVPRETWPAVPPGAAELIAQC